MSFRTLGDYSAYFRDNGQIFGHGIDPCSATTPRRSLALGDVSGLAFPEDYRRAPTSPWLNGEAFIDGHDSQATVSAMESQPAIYFLPSDCRRLTAL